MRERVVEPELMDDPSLDSGRHQAALRGLARLNRLSGAAGAVYHALADLAHAATPDEPLRVLDLASGGGDVAIALAGKGEGRIVVHGCDVSGRAVRWAQAAARRAGAPAEFFPLDALNDALPGGYHVMTCSLFIHHLAVEQARRLLGRMAEAAAKRVVVHDLHRSRLNLAMVAVGARLVSRSGVVHTDAVRSMRAAFTDEELRRLAEEGGVRGAVVRRRFPCRLLLTWSRS